MKQQLASGPSLKPPKTLGVVVRQARDAFRRYRQDSAGARQPSKHGAAAGATAVPPSPPVSPQTPQATQPQQQHLSLLDQLLEPPQQQQQKQQQQQSLQQQQPQQQLLQQQQWQQTSAEAQQVQQPLLQGCTRLKLQLPLPVASAAPPCVPLMEQPYSLFDEGDWPGGIVQRFRALRALVDATLEGYDPQFLGMLEDPADGMGCWSIGTDTTVVGLVTNATFSNFAKLCQGGYGSRPMQAGHTLVAVNPDWTGPQDIGQFWDRKLKAAAEEVLSEPWQYLYSCQVVRTSRGKGFGLLVCSYGLGWHLWPADEESSSSVRDECLLWGSSRPEQADIIAALNEAVRVSGAGKQGGLGALLDKWQTRDK